MLNFVHVCQALVLLALTQVVMKLVGVSSFSSPNFQLSSAVVTTLVTVLFHVSLVYLNVTPLLYMWFMLSVLHHHFHAFWSRKTIVESEVFTIDEVWHLVNQLLCMRFMVSNNFDTVYIYTYTLFFTAYFIMMIGTIVDYKRDRHYKFFLYYLGSFMSSFFILSIHPFFDMWGALFFFTTYYVVVTIITYDNWVGRRLTLLNIAGASFISEALVLYLDYNNIYAPYK